MTGDNDQTPDPIPSSGPSQPGPARLERSGADRRPGLLGPFLLTPAALGPTLDPALLDPGSPGPIIDPTLLGPDSPGPTLDLGLLEHQGIVEPSASFAQPSDVAGQCLTDLDLADPCLTDPGLADPGLTDPTVDLDAPSALQRGIASSGNDAQPRTGRTEGSLKGPTRVARKGARVRSSPGHREAHPPRNRRPADFGRRVGQ